MKKIMFNDKYGLTRAVLEGRKTMTRRTAYDKPMQYEYRVGNEDGYLILLDGWFRVAKSAYRVGEEVAVAQDYDHVLTEYLTADNINNEAFKDFNEWSNKQQYGIWDKAGLGNKLFVKAELMPHRIHIKSIKVERIQDISDEDVYKEGFRKESVNNGWGNAAWHWEAMLTYMDNLGRYKEIRSGNPKEAFSFLIDKVSGNGTWERNPWMFVYDFELIR